MQVLIIKRRILLYILLGLLLSAGYHLSRLPLMQTVFGPQSREVAIVIDDFGGYAAGVKEMMALPYQLTFAVMPFEEFALTQAELASNKGFEIIVHMPFEAVAADPCWYGKKYIYAGSTPLEIRKLIDESFHILPMAVGLNNHMGSKATADSTVMKEVFKELRRINRFYLDSKTTFTVSPAARIASDLHLPFLERDLFLDDRNSAEFMQRQLKKLTDQAKIKGMAVGIGHVGRTGPTLAEVLRKEIPRYEEEGFRFVPLSELVYTRVNKSYKNIVIGIDPGHGGIDSGTRWENVLEKDLNLKFSQELAQGLAKRGYTAVLTRNADQLLTSEANYSNKSRPYKLDDFRCRIQKLESEGVSVIISLHVNWNRLAYHRGPLVYYPIHSPEAQRIACTVQDHLNRVQPFRKLPKPADYYLLNQADVPTILVELGFLSNPEDRRLLQDHKYLERLKSAIIDGLAEAFSNSQ